MEDQTLRHIAHNITEVDPTGTHPPAHVHQEGVNQPAGANATHDLKRGLETGQQPMNMAVQEPSTLQGAPNVQVVEEKLPFKEQVRAYHKIHRGTVGDLIIIETLDLIWFLYSSSETMS